MQESRVLTTFGTLRTPFGRRVLGAQASHVSGKRWIRASPRLGMRVETQHTGLDTFSIRGRLHTCRASHQSTCRVGSDPQEQH
eukprot:9320154-Pyramimonas_sp.AAC.1